ncbi:thioredoxin domain-containing protein [Dyadobacter psychrotolerans]|uniref:Thioredoxin 1 n=1 Tax=Dyadobacter psychrotolerans TaxID=2541721 RepID=A0A4R5DM26_9BACT|nr:thioredoxin domain-containing protein [Dyadobacter psychrotolerans]TDE11713.1 thioredoxin 1 [Dyadobacter psychrotolerans]
MKKNILLFVFILFNGLATKAQTKLNPDDFEKKLAATKQGQLIDVRTPGEYKDGHLKNAQNIDYKNQAFKDKIKTLDKNKPVFVYCLGGVRSAAAANILHENGFSEIYDMTGGYLKWTSAGKITDAPTTKTATGMDMAGFKKLIGADEIVLIDFYAPWCAPCVEMLPTVHKLSEEYKGKVTIRTIEYDQNKALAKELGIDEIPAFLLYKNGKLVKRTNGLIKEPGFRKMLDSSLGK